MGPGVFLKTLCPRRESQRQGQSQKVSAVDVIWKYLPKETRAKYESLKYLLGQTDRRTNEYDMS